MSTSSFDAVSPGTAAFAALAILECEFGKPRGEVIKVLTAYARVNNIGEVQMRAAMGLVASGEGIRAHPDGSNAVASQMTQLNARVAARDAIEYTIDFLR